MMPLVKAVVIIIPIYTQHMGTKQTSRMHQSAQSLTEWLVIVSKVAQHSYRGRPLPRPLAPPPGSALGASWFDFGLRMVSSTDRMRAAASHAAVRALIFTTAGSQTQASKLSTMSSCKMSTPNQMKPGRGAERGHGMGCQEVFYSNCSLGLLQCDKNMPHPQLCCV